MSPRMSLRTTIALAAVLSLAQARSARATDAAPPSQAPAATPPPAAQPKGQAGTGGGGDGGAKPKAASMVIEEDSTSAEAPPPPPRGEERDAIGLFIREQTVDVQECYSKRLAQRPTLQGKLVARFDIGPSGKVIGATADGIQDRELLSCVITIVRKWEFAKPSSGGKLRVAYPWNLRPVAAP